MSYSIINKGDTVGQMQITKRIAGEDIFFMVASTVQTKMLMNIKVNVQEEAHYRKGELLSSSSKRFVNDKPKGEKRTERNGDGYLITDGDKQDKLNQKSILYDFCMLYFKEPVNTKEVYSNYFQKNLPIQVQNNHTYEIDLPEGGQNIYYYTNGTCSRVDIHNAFYNSQMIVNR